MLYPKPLSMSNNIFLQQFPHCYIPCILSATRLPYQWNFTALCHIPGILTIRNSHTCIFCNHWPGEHVERLVDHALQVAQMLQGGITLAVCSLIVWVEQVLVVGHSVMAVLVESTEQFLQTLLDFVCLDGKEWKRSTLRCLGKKGLLA